MHIMNAVRGSSGLPCGCRAKRGFVMSAEAMFAMLFFSLAVSSLFLFNFQRHDSELFYACSDAAVVLAKTGDFSFIGNLESQAAELSELSGACVMINNAGAQSPLCAAGQAGEKIALTIPAWDGSQATSVKVTCSRPR